MAKISLDIEDKNLATVLNILENLKVGLIKNIEVNKNKNLKAVSSSLTNSQNKRYISKDKYKQKLQQKVLEDEFLAKQKSSSKYLSPNEFKNRLTKG